MTLDLYKLTIDKEAFKKTPIAERAFYIKSMNFLTDIGIIQKCSLHSMSRKNDVEPIKQSAESIQTMFFIRHLAGLLFEGYELIRTGFWPNRLGESYDIEELEPIKTYFSKADNLIFKIRNKFAYHLDLNLIKEETEKIPDDEPLELYLTEESGNCLYKAGDNILLLALIRLASKPSLKEGLDTILGEVLPMAQHFQRFFGHFIAQFHETYFGLEMPKDKMTLDVPKLSEVDIPYFVAKD